MFNTDSPFNRNNNNKPYNAIFDNDNDLLDADDWKINPDRTNNIKEIVLTCRLISSDPFMKMNNDGTLTPDRPMYAEELTFDISHRNGAPNTHKEIICAFTSADECRRMAKYIDTEAQMLAEHKLNDMNKDDIRKLLSMAIKQTRISNLMNTCASMDNLENGGIGPGRILNELNGTTDKFINFNISTEIITKIGIVDTFFYQIDMPPESRLRHLQAFAAEDNFDIDKQTGFVVSVKCLTMGFDPDNMHTVGCAVINLCFIDENKKLSPIAYLHPTNIIGLDNPENLPNAVRRAMMNTMDWITIQIGKIEKLTN